MIVLTIILLFIILPDTAKLALFIQINQYIFSQLK